MVEIDLGWILGTLDLLSRAGIRMLVLMIVGLALGFHGVESESLKWLRRAAKDGNEQAKLQLRALGGVAPERATK